MILSGSASFIVLYISDLLLIHLTAEISLILINTFPLLMYFVVQSSGIELVNNLVCLFCYFGTLCK